MLASVSRVVTAPIKSRLVRSHATHVRCVEFNESKNVRFRFSFLMCADLR